MSPAVACGVELGDGSHTAPRVPFSAVWLWNTGDNAFQRELYGEAILVRKTISKSSKVELLNTAEQVVASGASAVNMLLEHIGVDACNPITVLTQDMARSMLRRAMRMDAVPSPPRSRC